MGLKLGQNINFRPFFFFFVSQCFWSRQSFLVVTLVATACLVATLVATYCLVATLVATACLVATLVGTYFLVATYFLSRHTFWSRHTSCRDILPVATYFLTATCFFSPTCRGHNFFILTRIWACEYSLERSLNVECRHDGI